MKWIEPNWLAPAHVRALSTTRDGGVSQGVFAGLNLGGHVGDEPARVEANRARLRLVRAGITAVYGGEECTFSDSEQFYSYRRDGQTGRMSSIIWLAS